jgi:hypothetical protein
MKLKTSLGEKKGFVEKVDELVKNESISVKEACKQLDTPYWKYFNALKAIKSGKKKARVEAKELSTTPVSSELNLELVFKGDTAKLVREYALAYDVEPEVVCRIMIIDALKDKQ